MERDSNKLAICVPTHNRQSVITKFVMTICKVIHGRADLFIFDTSDEALNIENISGCKGGLNLINEIGVNKHPNEKFIDIYEFMRNSNYEYIWLIHDHTIFDEEAFQYVLQCLDENINIFLLNMQASDYGYHSTDDYRSFALDYSWTMNSIGTIIVNRKSFLSKIDFRSIRKKYVNDYCISYSHIGLYLEGIVFIENICAGIIDIKREHFIDFLREEKPSWYQNTIQICCNTWGNVIKRLPCEYNKIKKQIIKKQDQFFLSDFNLYRLKTDKAYDIKLFLKNVKWLKLIRDKSIINALYIAIFPAFIVEKLLFHGLQKKYSYYKQSKYRICLYGAGRHGKEYAEILQSLGFEINAVLVTDILGNPKEICGIQVYNADNYISHNSCFIMIAVQSKSVRDVKMKLDEYILNGNMIDYMALNA